MTADFQYSLKFQVVTDVSVGTFLVSAMLRPIICSCGMECRIDLARKCKQNGIFLEFISSNIHHYNSAV